MNNGMKSIVNSLNELSSSEDSQSDFRLKMNTANKEESNSVEAQKLALINKGVLALLQNLGYSRINLDYLLEFIIQNYLTIPSQNPSQSQSPSQSPSQSRSPSRSLRHHSQKIVCLEQTSNVGVVSSNGNKYVFNAPRTGVPVYNEDTGYGLSEGDYTLVGVPEEHPIAILNKRGNNGDQISYAPKISGNYEVDITFIKVVGGQLQPPYYQFYLWGAPYGWANGPEIFINNSDNTFKFMRNKQYIFNFNEVDSQHPFKLFINKGTEEPPLNDQNDYQFTFSSDDNSEFTINADTIQV